ncbi:fibroblast growth factor receptor-like [Glandiceps talaboti]
MVAKQRCSMWFDSVTLRMHWRESKLQRVTSQICIVVWITICESTQLNCSFRHNPQIPFWIKGSSTTLIPPDDGDYEFMEDPVTYDFHLHVKKATMQQNDYYTCGDLYEVPRARAYIYVIDLSTVDLSTLHNEDVIEGDEVTISCSSYDGNPDPYRLELYFSDGNSEIKLNSTNAGALVHIINDINRSQNGTYRCYATTRFYDSTEDSSTDEMEIIVYYPPKIYTNETDVIETCLDVSKSIECMADAYPIANITWYDNNVTITEEDNNFQIYTKVIDPDSTVSSTLMVINVQSSDLGEYTCVANNGIREDDSKTMELKEITQVTCTPCSCPTGLTIFLTILFTLIIVAAVEAFLYFFWWNRRQPKNVQQGDSNHANEAMDNVNEDPSHEYMVLSPQRDKHIYTGLVQRGREVLRESLCLRDLICEGDFGKVVKGEAWNIASKDGMTVVAVKMLKDNTNESDRCDLLKELDLLRTISNHPNVVSLLGCCTQEPGPIYVILEYMCKGNLQNYLRENRPTHGSTYANLHQRSRTLTERDLLTFAYDVAMGMEFLSKKQCVHSDLAARNILINEHNVCKVGDFGLARDVVDKHQYERKTQGKLPIRWMAIESLVDDIYTTQSDVWSYGALLWEIVTMGYRPYPGMSGQEVIESLKEGYRMPKPPQCKDELYAIMTNCWKEDPKTRPKFVELTRQLKIFVNDGKVYIDLTEAVFDAEGANYDGERC